MAAINWRRVVLGGLAAGVVANAFDFLITAYLMASEFASMQTRLGVTEDAARAWIPIFAAGDFVWGFVLVFAYAAIRPRFGPGPRTAVISGIMLWLVIIIFAVVLLALGLHTPQSFFKSSAFYLVSALVSSVVGAGLYKE